MRARTVIITSMLAVLAICLWAAGAKAHDLWKSGDPVPPWVKSSCCGKDDAHNLPDSDVKVTRAGYLVAGRAAPIPHEKATPSPDGTYWVFYAGDNIATATIYCFFVPIGAT